MASTIVLVACCLSFIGWVRIVVMAFQDDDTTWGIITLLFSPAAVVYGLKHFDRAWISLALIGGGIGLRLAMYAMEWA